MGASSTKGRLKTAATELPRRRPSGRQIGLAVAIVGLLLTVIGLVLQARQGAGTEQKLEQGCQAIGDDATLNCPSIESGPEPSVQVVPGPLANTWSLRIRNFEAGSSVQIALRDPNGTDLDLGKSARRPVQADGSADTASDYYFWQHVPGEPTGMYTVTVTGPDQGGDTEVKQTTFEVPGT
jgi:hypothetical protein